MYINIAKVDFGKYYRGESPGPVEEYYGMYITPASDSAINVTPNDSYNTLHGKYLKYSLNGKTWNDWNGSVTIEPEKKMYLKGEDDYVWNSSTSGKLITSDGYYNVGGDISSLTNEIAEVKEYTFYSLFSDDSYIKDASSLILPATTLADSCYQNMFKGCNSLTVAPELPATTLATQCYSNMFSSCSSLTSAPVLHVTTLAPRCYLFMFNGCSSLTTAPELPATTLTTSCYGGMFAGCNSLTTAPALPATTLAQSCYQNMFDGCAALTTAPALPATELNRQCYQDMFKGCTSLTAAPELPATTLASNCYNSMFNACSSLTTAPALPATTLAESCYPSMFSGCSSLTTAPELPATTLTPSCYPSMFRGCTSLNNITMLATNISAPSSLTNWVYGVSSTGTFTKSPEMTSLPKGTDGIPEGWTVKDYGGSGGDYSQEYMTLSALGDGEITITIPAAINSSLATSISYSKDKSTWNETLIDDTAQTISIPVTSGENVYLKGIAKQLGNSDTGVNINSTANINAYGNIMSLLYGDDYKDKVAFKSGSQYTFIYLFKNNTHLINAENLILPTTTLTYGCYQYMFNGCSSLTTAPELHATKLGWFCYSGMFQGCKSLNNITMLATNISAVGCLSYWVSGVSSTGTFTKAAEMTSLPTGESGIPEGWTVVDYGAA